MGKLHGTWIRSQNCFWEKKIPISAPRTPFSRKPPCWPALHQYQCILFTSGDLALRDGDSGRTGLPADLERARSRRAAHLVLRGWPLTWSFFCFLGEFERLVECLKHLELLEESEGQNLHSDSESGEAYPDPLFLEAWFQRRVLPIWLGVSARVHL